MCWCLFCHRRTLKLQLVVYYLFLMLLSVLSAQDDQPRLFYNIAHMTNSIKEVDYYLEKGANALEADVMFTPNGTATYIYHGYPCDCFRHCTEKEAFIEYIEYIREITTPGKVQSD